VALNRSVSPRSTNGTPSKPKNRRPEKGDRDQEDSPVGLAQGKGVSPLPEQRGRPGRNQKSGAPQSRAAWQALTLRARFGDNAGNGGPQGGGDDDDEGHFRSRLGLKVYRGVWPLLRRSPEQSGCGVLGCADQHGPKAVPAHMIREADTPVARSNRIAGTALRRPAPVGPVPNHTAPRRWRGCQSREVEPRGGGWDKSDGDAKSLAGAQPGDIPLACLPK
jgi:hypothetical protein